MKSIVVVLVFGVWFVVALAVDPWQISLEGTCWTNVSCRRAMIVSHGGDWDLSRPYDSLLAFDKARQEGAECVKGDFRVSSDRVGVVMHSSPIQLFESLDCAGKKVEEMTVAQCTSCHMGFTKLQFLSVPQLVQWAANQSVVMLCVKEGADISRAIDELLELNASKSFFLEIRVGDVVKYVLQAKPRGWDRVYYLVEIDNLDGLRWVLSAAFAPLRPRAFMVEFDAKYESWLGNVSVASAIHQLHQAGMRALAVSSTFMPSVESQANLFRAGFDVVYTYGTISAVEAKKIVNRERGINPPNEKII